MYVYIIHLTTGGQIKADTHLADDVTVSRVPIHVTQHYPCGSRGAPTERR